MTIEELKERLKELLPLTAVGSHKGQPTVTIEKVFKAIEIIEKAEGKKAND